MSDSFQIKKLTITILPEAEWCPTPTACNWPITTPLDAEFQETAVNLLSEALEELRKAPVKQPPGDVEPPADE